MAAGAFRRAIRLDYRCPQDCCLLQVWSTPRGLMFHAGPYTMAPALLATTDERARELHTDGRRKWNGRAGSLDYEFRFWLGASATAGLTLACDHVRRFISFPTLKAEIDQLAPRRATRRVISGSTPFPAESG